MVAKALSDDQERGHKMNTISRKAPKSLSVGPGTVWTACFSWAASTCTYIARAIRHEQAHRKILKLPQHQMGLCKISSFQNVLCMSDLFLAKYVQVLAAQEEQDVQTVPGATDSGSGLGVSQQAQSQADLLQVQKLTQQVCLCFKKPLENHCVAHTRHLAVTWPPFLTGSHRRLACMHKTRACVICTRLSFAYLHTWCIS